MGQDLRHLNVAYVPLDQNKWTPGYCRESLPSLAPSLLMGVTNALTAVLQLVSFVFYFLSWFTLISFVFLTIHILIVLLAYRRYNQVLVKRRQVRKRNWEAWLDYEYPDPPLTYAEEQAKIEGWGSKSLLQKCRNCDGTGSLGREVCTYCFGYGEISTWWK